MASVPKKKKIENKPKAPKGISDGEVSTNWDVDYYKTDHESDEHWDLRRKFMVTYKDQFPEDQLVCLAQVFVNMEFMGCKYPSETMRMVAELAKDVAKDFRDSRNGRLKRTFVTASDAAEQKAKAMVNRTSKQDNNSKRMYFGSGQWVQAQDSTQTSNSETMADFFKDLPYKNFILTMCFGRNAIMNSAIRCNVKYKEEEDMDNREEDCRIIKVSLDNKFVAKAAGENLKAAKAAAFDEALEKLQKSCFCLQPNPNCDTITISRSGNKIDLNVTKATTEDQKIDPNNKGYKMLKLMGWQGGGLGSKTQGREEPVSYLLKNNRQGLGNNTQKVDHKYFRQILENYLKADDVRDLKFESSFTKEERAAIHSMSERLGLNSKSYGRESDRYLIVRKKISDTIILEEILLKKNPVFCKRYLVQVPPTLALKFPEYTEHLKLIQ